jgi:glycosyltransferase involved in cell wall biosynthesis
VTSPATVLFVYWGRRGAMTRFTHGVMSAALSEPDVRPLLSISRQNEDFALFEDFGANLLPVDTFSRGSGALTEAWRIGGLRRDIERWVASRRVNVVVNLMPHVWSGFIIVPARRGGAHYATVVHDATMHSGDRTALVNRFLLREVERSDRIITLSNAVRDQLVQNQRIDRERIATLFHPDLAYGTSGRAPRQASGRFRLLLFGRILPYKGLGLLVEALEKLKGEGLEIDLGVYGDGDLSAEEPRLYALGATVVNRWFRDAEIADIFGRYDAVVLSHTEASQSGVAAVGFGAGLPVVATPVGGLREQVQDGVNGILSGSVTADGLADAVRRLALDHSLYDRLRTNIASSAADRSMVRFVHELVTAVGIEGRELVAAPRNP